MYFKCRGILIAFLLQTHYQQDSQHQRRNQLKIVPTSVCLDGVVFNFAFELSSDYQLF